MSVGFAAGTASGEAEIFIDGDSQGVVDLYRHDDTDVSFTFDNLISATHTISVSVLGTKNPLASQARVNLDYFEVWDGTPMDDGAFEEDNARVWRSGGWSYVSNAAASGGQYLRSTTGVAWLPFTGDSFTYQALAYSSAGTAQLYLDGVYLTDFDLYSPTTVTRTISFENLGDRPHVLQIHSYRGYTTIDRLLTPGQPPFFTPPDRSGVSRYEEDDPAILYNGVSVTRTSTSWSLVSSVSASDGYFLRSSTAGDAASFTFNGSWVGVGLAAGTASGEAEIFIDGVSRGVVDAYRATDTAISFYYDDLISTTHTISVSVLGTKNPLSSQARVNVDFFDAWDGTAMPDGVVEGVLDVGGRIWRGSSWAEAASPEASEGAYIRNGQELWFPFTGDAISYRGLAFTSAGNVRVTIDGQFITNFDLYSPATISRTISFDGLGDGPHVLQVSNYRGNANVDTFITPGSGPFFTPSSSDGLVRYEEDHPALRFNGVPIAQTASSWSGSYAATRASRGYVARSNTLSDTVSLTFAGTWAGLGFVTATSSGYVEVRLDGVSRGIVDTYSATNDVTEVYYSGLVSGTHTLEVIVLDDANPSAGNTYVHLDYIDVWNGVDEADGWYEADRTYADNDRVDMSADWDIVNDVGARGGAFWEDGSNAWFRFTGEAVTVRAFGHGNDAASAQVWIDGVDYGVLDLNYEWTRSPLVFHYTGLDAGPHVLRFQGFTKPGLDAFEANPTAFDPGVPLVEWADVDITGAVLNTAVAGDINGDGVTELVSTSSNGTMYVYRGDGQDAGTGSPLIWSVALGGEPDSAALADLDGQAGSEIVVGSPTGLYAFHADGSLYWFTNAVKSTWRAISIGNLDDDPEPEIVTTGQNCPCVIEPDGSAVTWRGTFNYPLTPNLADLTGDGRLDILTGSGSTLYLYDTSTNPPTLAWSTTLPATIDGRGTPAIADVDGQQPGGDDGPEIVVVSSGAIHLLDADGTELWSYATAAGAPGGVSIADTDGDGEVEIIASAQVDGGTLYALNADGTLLWNAPAVDTTSANSVSVLDLDGDGVWEVVWNGFNQGLTVFRGSDGAILFNEPLINSTTRIDYPIIADVDGDGAAEIVTNDDQGFYVVGFDPVWAPSRPLWNQYNYAITNVGDDLSVPPTEPPSWLVHNTYRTQTPLNTVLPAYQVTITHTASITGVHVLSDTFVISPTIAGQDYAWGYTQRWYEANRGNRFDAVLPDMTPGELRQISEGTEVVYRLPSGRNHLTLPPLFVSALHIIAVAPPTSTVSPGGSATYTVTLTNPAATADVYALSLAGLPPEWVALPASVNMPANSVVDVPLVVQPPVTAADSAHLFVVSVVNIGGGQDEAGAALTVSDGLDLTLDPPARYAVPGQVVSYSLTLTNRLDTAQTVDLSAVGAPVVVLPGPVALAAQATTTLPVWVSGPVPGPFSFSVNGVSQETGATDGDSAVLHVVGEKQVDVAITPASASGGVASPIPYTVTVTNLGTVADSYALSVIVPANWSYELTANNVPVTGLTLTPYLFNSADLSLVVTSPAGAAPGGYPLSVTAVSTSHADVSDTDNATAVLTTLGVDIAILPTAQTVLNPGDPGSWQVQVTNMGSVGDTYGLASAGIFAPYATFTPDTVTLAPGASQTVQLDTTPLYFPLAQTYQLHAIATSATDAQVQDADQTPVTFLGSVNVDVAWDPPEQLVDEIIPVSYILVITNTGNLPTTYDIAGAFGLLQAQVIPNVITLAAHDSANLLVTVIPPDYGVYTFDGTATAGSVSDSDTALLEVAEPTVIQLQTGATGVPDAAPTLWGGLFALLLAATWLTFRRRRVVKTH